MLFQLLPINLLAFQSGTSQTDLVAGAECDPPAMTSRRIWRNGAPFMQRFARECPALSFAGPDVSGATDWIAAFAQAMPEGLVLLTHHCYADGPAGAPHVFLPKLLQSARHLSPLLERLAQYSHRYHLPFRIVETNSIYDEGQQGVSDTLGAALWGLELMFQAAAAGAAGINFHGGIHSPRASDDKAYTPIARMGNRYRAATLYYGMLMFAQAAPGSLIPAQLAPDAGGLKAFAVRAPDETLCVCLINQNITRDERVAIDSGRSFTAASVLRLAGPAIDATGGVTLGGASVDEFGRWAPLMHEEVHLTGNKIIVDVPAASAALVSLRG
jgi:hypothetical protein